jgi:hypothetical protein
LQEVVLVVELVVVMVLDTVVVDVLMVDVTDKVTHVSLTHSRFMFGQQSDPA